MFLVRAENRSTRGKTSRKRKPTNSTHILRWFSLSINDVRSHKLLALFFWLSANHDNFNWMITRGNTNWTTWPSHVGDNRTECSISFISFIYLFIKISSSTRVASSWSCVTCVYSPLSLADIANYALYTQRNCFESVFILVTTPTSSHNLTNERTRKENWTNGEVLEEKTRICKGK